ncbi:MAG: hypothetical protein A2945_01675 [Candidatus Liptonbacteria bacterium RIFCSPLOWO2_01_FULL_52_25]|uniref:PIG-L family deacetylase n=1 Tax=Candidatus Liptonbacteria bacterium RIFCSPLOWO2_01_FULL_52_25 TaxID=1798650 RepID=A0A1G2CHW1_9BACT|nr:MAG: hypothetical protein A2945_01675 [Candidatus Liptonbacteria bacterium RIFCSPLOWO2_01_FULL_52_25]
MSNTHVPFLGKRLLICVAHPDDESFAAAGTMHENRKRGGKTFVACATLGEKGKSHLARPISDAELKRIRKGELLAASRFLGVSKVYMLGMPDGKLRFHPEMLFRKTLAFAKKVKPDFILGFGADGISGHTDHITVGRAAKRAAHRLKVPYVAFALSPRFADDATSWLKQRRRHGHYRRSIAFRTPNTTVPINARVKKRALRFHKSQMDGPRFAGFPKYAARELLRAEHFFIK